MRDYDERNQKCPVCGYSEEEIQVVMEEKPDVLPPETILGGRYIIGRSLSYTDYAITYIAWDALLQKRAAIKELLPLGMVSRAPGKTEAIISGINKEKFEKSRAAFEEEISKWNQNQDIPCLLNIYRCVQQNHTSYMVMEYLEGCTLRDYIEEHSQLTPKEAAELFSKILHGLEKLHSRGIWHHNLSPDNIYLDQNGEIIFIDPGMAKEKCFYLVEGDLDIYERAFIAPELLLGRDTALNTDLYSLGAIYYFLITGRDPREGTYKRKPKDLATGNREQEAVLELLMKHSQILRPQSIEDFWNRYKEKGGEKKNGQKR